MHSVSRGASKLPLEIELGMMRPKKANTVVGPSIISMATSAPSTVGTWRKQCGCLQHQGEEDCPQWIKVDK